MNQNQLDEIARRVSYAAKQFAPGHRPSVRQTVDACSVLRDMIQATEMHGLTFGDFDAVADFPRMALQLVKARDDESR
ncbi:hypothetical protein ABZS88_23370 [Streptomyces sp. NPDC005480]|uniref:hypothetical protein n=1 Tax=Streptomyces sp. NPDC005480 TaxID=3154880 RepID=UPI0033B26B1F